MLVLWDGEGAEGDVGERLEGGLKKAWEERNMPVSCERRRF